MIVITKIKMLRQQVDKLQQDIIERSTQLKVTEPDVIVDLQHARESLRAAEEKLHYRNDVVPPVCNTPHVDTTIIKASVERVEQYELFANTSHELMTVIGKNYRYKAVNSAFCDAHNKSQEDIINRTAANVWGEDAFNIVIKGHLDKCFAGNEVHYQSWFEFAALGQRCCDVSYYPFYNSEGVVTDIVAVSRDITEYRSTQEMRLKVHNELELRVKQLTAALAETNTVLKQEIAERKQAEKETRQINHKLMTLQVAGATIAYSLDIHYILDTVTQEMVTLMGTESCAVFEWNQVQDTITIVAQNNPAPGPDKESQPQIHCLTKIPSIKQVCLKRSAQQMTVSQADIDPADLAYMKNKKIKTLLLLPMEFQNQVIGLVELADSRVEHTFTFDEIGAVQLLANQAASAVQNAKLYKELQKKLEEQKRIEQELRQSEAKNNALLQVFPDLIFRINVNGVILDYTAGSIDDLYTAPENFLNRHVSDVLPSEIGDLIERYIKKTLATNISQVIEYQLPVFSNPQDFEARFVVCDENEVLAIVRNITRRKQTEEQLHKLSRAVKQSPSLVIITDVKGNIEYANPKFTQITGYTLKEIIGKNPRILKSGQLPPETYEHLWATIIRGNEWQGEFYNKKKNGEFYWASASISPIRDSHGNITHFLAVQEDITERKKMEEALRRSEANLRAIFDNSLQTFILIDKDHKVQTHNKSAYELIKKVYGCTLRDGQSIYEFIPELEIDEFNRISNQVFNGEPVSQERKLSMDGIYKWFQFDYNPVIADDGQIVGLCFSTIDVDQRIKALETRAASEARLWAEMRGMLAITRTLVSEFDITRVLNFIADQAKNLLGADETAVLLLSDDGQRFEVAAPIKSPLKIKRGLKFPVQGSLAELALTKHQVQVSNRIQVLELIDPVLALLKPPGAYSLLCAPLSFQHKNLGVLLVWNTQEKLFEASHNLLIEAFADQAALALYNANLHRQNRLLAIEQERHRLARDLHDSVTQSLYSIGLAANAATRLLNQRAYSQLQNPVAHIHTLSQTALAEIREQLYHLHPTPLGDKDLVETLAQDCSKLSHQYALNIEFESSSEPALSKIQRDSIYFVAREALWNCIKHANATRVKVRLFKENDQTVLSVKDDGIGFDPNTVAQSERMGLRNIKERIRLIDGTYKLQSKPQEGTCLTVQTPVQLH